MSYLSRSTIFLICRSCASSLNGRTPDCPEYLRRASVTSCRDTPAGMQLGNTCLRSISVVISCTECPASRNSFIACTGICTCADTLFSEPFCTAMSITKNPIFTILPFMLFVLSAHRCKTCSGASFFVTGHSLVLGEYRCHGSVFKLGGSEEQPSHRSRGR